MVTGKEFVYNVGLRVPDGLLGSGLQGRYVKYNVASSVDYSTLMSCQAFKLYSHTISTIQGIQSFQFICLSVSRKKM